MGGAEGGVRADLKPPPLYHPVFFAVGGSHPQLPGARSVNDTLPEEPEWDGRWRFEQSESTWKVSHLTAASTFILNFHLTTSLHTTDGMSALQLKVATIHLQFSSLCLLIWQVSE